MLQSKTLKAFITVFMMIWLTSSVLLVLHVVSLPASFFCLLMKYFVGISWSCIDAKQPLKL